MSDDKITIMHLRATGDPYGPSGANRVVWETARHISAEHFRCVPCFLSKTTQVETAARPDLPPHRIARGGRWIDPRLAFRLRAIALGLSAKIVHCHDYKANAYGLILRRLIPRLKTVATIHGYIGNTLKGKLYCSIDRILIRHFDRLIVVSQALKDAHFSGDPANLSLIRNAVDTDYWRPDPESDPTGTRNPTDAFVVGFSGRISREKGWPAFLEIARKLVEANERFTFIVAGDGPERQTMERLAAKYNIEANCQFLGAQRDMKAAYSKMDVLLAPSLTEGLPMAQIEAGAMGVAVVASAVGGVPELITDGQNGFLSRPGDISSFASHIIQLQSHPEGLERMKEEARRVVVERFSLESQLPKLEKIYSELATSAAPVG